MKQSERIIAHLDAETRRRLSDASAAAHAAATLRSIADLHALRGTTAFWRAMESLTDEQRVLLAIDYSAWLETQGTVIKWGTLLDGWERRLFVRAACRELLAKRPVGLKAA